MGEKWDSLCRKAPNLEGFEPIRIEGDSRALKCARRPVWASCRALVGLEMVDDAA